LKNPVTVEICSGNKAAKTLLIFHFKSAKNCVNDKANREETYLENNKVIYIT